MRTSPVTSEMKHKEGDPRMQGTPGGSEPCRAVWVFQAVQALVKSEAEHRQRPVRLVAVGGGYIAAPEVRGPDALPRGR